MRYVAKNVPDGDAVIPHGTICFALILEEGLTKSDFKMLFKPGKGNI